MIRYAATLATVLLAGCLPFQSTRETAEFVRLPVEPLSEEKGAVYPAPITTATAPAYLEQSTIWYSDREGRLTSIKGFLWAESLPDAIRRGFVLLLAGEKPFPENLRIDLQIDRFLLLGDGSGSAIIEAVVTADGSAHTLPIVQVEPQDLWNPESPGTFLAGYRDLLLESGKKLKASVLSVEKKQ